MEIDHVGALGEGSGPASAAVQVLLRMPAASSEGDCRAEEGSTQPCVAQLASSSSR